MNSTKNQGRSVIVQKIRLDGAQAFQWPTEEPFLFCVHHKDQYPSGDGQLALRSEHWIGRNRGQDFEEKNGFRTYHGDSVPGFPVHPHRGFETVTIVRKGFVDHADSLGAAGRYGEGDVQWMTAGSGVQHSEMFPLIYEHKENFVELFQIWLNLPKVNKLAEPYFKMLWSEDIPRLLLDNQGQIQSADSSVKTISKKESLEFKWSQRGLTEIQLIAGSIEKVKAVEPPPNSWAHDEKNSVNIFLVKMSPGGILRRDSVEENIHRWFYFFEGKSIDISGEKLDQHTAGSLQSRTPIEIENTSDSVIEFLWLEARGIQEPISQYGPFVMNDRSEIQKAFSDYQRTQFGGWPWPRPDMVHGGSLKNDLETVQRFARFPDGRLENPKERS